MLNALIHELAPTVPAADGPLHGWRIAVKDNMDVAGTVRTDGLAPRHPPPAARDAVAVERLRSAGALIVGKTNLEALSFGATTQNRHWGACRNPWDPTRIPGGSSGGSAVAVAAGLVRAALGTDTGGSIRQPAALCGITGLRPSHGAIPMDGVTALAPSFDTVGPMARHVADLAAALNVMAGPDPRDPATAANAGKIPADYLAGLKPDALKGARLGLMRDFMKSDPAVDAVVETAVAILRKQGATVVDVKLPRYVIGLNGDLYETIRETEFHVQIEQYLATLPRKDLPKTLAEIVAQSEKVLVTEEGWEPNRGRLETMKRSMKAGKFGDEPYRSAVGDGRKMVRENLEAIVAKEKLDALIAPTSGRPAGLLRDDAGEPPASGAVPAAADAARPAGGGVGYTRLINLAGWPELIVPAGLTSEPVLPVTLSFIGPAFSEARLLALGYAFEQALPVRVLPAKTPALANETITY